MKKTLVVVFLLFFAVSQAAFSGSLKIGYVDMDRIANESEAGKEVKREFAEYINKVQNQLKALRDEIKALQDEIKTKGRYMDEKALREKRMELERKMSDYKILYQDAQRELRERDRKVYEKLMAMLKRIIDKIGKKEGYTVIFEKNQAGILYGSPKVDLTNKVLKMFNEAYRKEKLKKTKK